MTLILAIDPGNEESGWCVIDADTCRPIDFGKTPNENLRASLQAGTFDDVDRVAIEMIASYGMAVGREVFETCVWIGRYLEIVGPHATDLVYRRDVKLHHCGSTKAKDSNITQALVDRFTPGVNNFGKGTKAEPGWFHGFAQDVWQAYALAVLVADRHELRQGVA
jgi:hypothetical protein